MTAHPTTFRCLPLACSLTVATCAARHRIANGPQKKHDAHGAGIRVSPCRGCAVGDAHQKGARPDRWPSGVAIERSDAPPALGGGGKDEEHMGIGRPAKLYAHNGLALSATDWAARPEIKALGLSKEMIRKRVKDGWSIDKVLTTPRIPEGAKREPKPTKKTAPTPKPAPAPRKAKAPPVAPTTPPPIEPTHQPTPTQFDDAIRILEKLGWSCSMVAFTPRGSVLVEIRTPEASP